MGYLCEKNLFHGSFELSDFLIYMLNADYFVILRLEDEKNGEDSQIYIYSLILDTLILFYVVRRIYFESQQMLAEKIAEYFSSLWNNIDVTLIVLSFFTTIFDILSCVEIWEYPSALKGLHALTIFFGYLRILSYARGIEGSSFMIKLIIKVMYDIRYFLLLMFIFIFALTSSGIYHFICLFCLP